MLRRIVEFGTDEAGERIAILDCGHPQHIRHQPPFINRPWTRTEAGRRRMLGRRLNCVRCEEGETAQRWWSATLGDGVTALGRLGEIEEAFSTAFDAAGRPVRMAVFKRHDSEKSLHCEVTVYFSPAAAEIARAFDARPCERPIRRNLELAAGDARCWQALF